MRPLLFLSAFLLLQACQDPSAGQESRLLIQNVLLPLEPPLTVRNVQSRAIRPLELPEGVEMVRLLRAEIGNPDFPDLNFAEAIRLYLVDPQGGMVLIAQSRPVPRNQASVLLDPLKGTDFLACFRQAKLDMVLEVDNTLVREAGIMLIGTFEFAYSLSPSAVRQN